MAETTSVEPQTQPKSREGKRFSEDKLPEASRKETKIALLVLFCLLNLKPQSYFRYGLDSILAKPEEWAPEGLETAMVNGLTNNAFNAWKDVKGLKADWTALKKVESKALKGIETPLEFLKATFPPRFKTYKALKAHKALTGKPKCVAYAKKLRAKIDELSQMEPACQEEGKRAISVFAKAEIDLRAEEQEKKLQALIDHGYRLCWLSSHADCSARCAPWQGKLVDIVDYSSLPSFRMPYKVEGRTVYSLKSIMAQVDRWGYRNNIINGFNCRHHLIPYRKGSQPPKHFSKKTMEEERGISNKLREAEREIRGLKRKAKLYNEIDRPYADRLQAQAEALTGAYKRYATNNGYRWNSYRLEV